MAQRKKHGSNVDVVRNIILGAIALIVIVVLGYSVLYALGWLESGDDRPYLDITGREIQTDPIEVIEFFSYACPICGQLDPPLNEWADSLPDDVEFRRIHIVARSAQIRLLALTHLALAQRNLDVEIGPRVFQEMERNPKSLETAQGFAEFLDGDEITAEQFLNLVQSPRLIQLRDTNEQFVRELGVAAVPAILVANKYVIPPAETPGGTIRKIDNVIAMIRSGELPVEVPEEEESESNSESDIDPSEETDTVTDYLDGLLEDSDAESDGSPEPAESEESDETQAEEESS